MTGSLGSYPAYFAWLAEPNRGGPELVASEPQLPAFSVGQIQALLRAGAVVVDVRPVADVAAGHIPDAVSIALRSAFATWLGWVVDPATPIIIVRNPDQAAADVLWPALNIGYQRIVGELARGMSAWIAAGQPVATTGFVPPGEVGGRVLDVRQRGEYHAGHLPNALHVELGSLVGRSGEIDSGPLTVMCGHGERAMTAATLLQHEGRRELSVLDGGAEDWARTTGRALHEGA